MNDYLLSKKVHAKTIHIRDIIFSLLYTLQKLYTRKTHNLFSYVFIFLDKNMCFLPFKFVLLNEVMIFLER